MSAPTDEQLRAAFTMLRAALAPDETLVICGADVEVTSKVQYANGTFQVTTKPKPDGRARRAADPPAEPEFWRDSDGEPYWPVVPNSDETVSDATPCG